MTQHAPPSLPHRTDWEHLTVRLDAATLELQVGAAWVHATPSPARPTRSIDGRARDTTYVRLLHPHTAPLHTSYCHRLMVDRNSATPACMLPPISSMRAGRVVQRAPQHRGRVVPRRRSAAHPLRPHRGLRGHQRTRHIPARGWGRAGRRATWPASCATCSKGSCPADMWHLPGVCLGSCSTGVQLLCRPWAPMHFYAAVLPAVCR